MPPRLIFALGPALAIATVAMAQPAGPPGAPPGGLRDGPRAEAMRAHHRAMKQQRLDDLRVVLRLRPDQEAALAAFGAAHEHSRFEKHAPPPSASQTTPQRLEEMARREDALRAARQKRRDALATFYAALSPDQQKVFDALQRLEDGPRGGPGRGGRHMVMMRGAHDGPMRHGGPGPDDD